MKVTIEIDATPQEMRTLMGLPDIEPLQQEIMEKMRERTLASIDATDPSNFLKLFMPTADHFKSMESLQASFWDAVGKSMDFSGKSPKDKE
jgi:hypothetical protein